MSERLKDALHPAGWTEPRGYLLSLLPIALVFVLVAILAARTSLPQWVISLALLPPFLVLALLTIRRLRDAGWSVWWALLLIVNINIADPDWALLPPLLTGLGYLVKLTPIAIGLVAPSATPRTI
jgi:uncharacterized membrane protein YhaH (DUF805 family)